MADGDGIEKKSSLRNINWIEEILIDIHNLYDIAVYLDVFILITIVFYWRVLVSSNIA